VYKVIFFVPLLNVEEVKGAMFEAGGGRIGHYDSCCWQIKGEGQFRPLSGSNAFIGQQGELECVEEFRVEMVCDTEVIRSVIAEMKRAHPYEEVAYDVIKLEEL
jgi:hypothetical protein